MTRLRLALAGALVVLACVPAGAAASWSEPQSMFSHFERNPKIGIDESGTISAAIAGYHSVGLFERPPAASDWSDPLVRTTLVNFATDPSWVDLAVSLSGAAVATWAISPNPGITPPTHWATYRPPGGKWRPAVQLGSGIDGDGGLQPVADDAGHVAVVWERRPDTQASVLDPPSEIVYSVPKGKAWTKPVKLADVATPDSEECQSNLLARLMPDGKPVVAWTETYATHAGVALCAVRATLAGGPVVDVTPRPAIGEHAEAPASMPSWSATALEVSPTDPETALVLRSQEEGFEVARGAGVSFSERSSAGTVSDVDVRLSQGRMLVVVSEPSQVKAGVGTTYPGLQTLWAETNHGLAAALAPDGSAHVLVAPNYFLYTGIRAFDASPGAPFGEPEVIRYWKPGLSSTALDCEGRPTIAWRELGGAGGRTTSATFEGPPAICNAALGPDLYPEPEEEGSDGGGDVGGGFGDLDAARRDSPRSGPLRLVALADGRLAGRGDLSIRVTCVPAAVGTCAGSITVLRSGGPGSPVSTDPAARLGGSEFAGLAPGQRRVLRVRLPKQARQALARGKKLQLAVRADVRDGAGNTRVTDKYVTLKRSR